MSDHKQEILRAVAKAGEVSRRWNPQPERTSFDIVGAVLSRDIPLVCRPLQGLQGATITVDDETRGILLATWPLFSVQRFTVAHELGHILLGHRNKFDTEVGEWIGRAPGANNVEEIAADTFAAEVLAPRRRIAQIARRQGWTQDDLKQAANVYQLSLRLGISFRATCVSLSRADIISYPRSMLLKETPVQELKRAIAGSDLEDSWADVWDLSPRDVGSVIEAGPNDVFRFRAEERGSAGYLWTFDQEPPLELVEQRRLPVFEYGAPGVRDVRVRIGATGIHTLRGRHRRPWNDETLEVLDLVIENYGKEREGFARRRRTQNVEEVAAC